MSCIYIKRKDIKYCYISTLYESSTDTDTDCYHNDRLHLVTAGNLSVSIRKMSWI